MVPVARQHLRAQSRQDAERAAAEVRGAEGRRPGAAAGRGQPALAAPGPRPGAERHRHRQAQEVARSTSGPGRGGSRCSCSACCCRCCSWPATCCSCAGSRRGAGCGTRAPARCRRGPPGSGATSSRRPARSGCLLPRRATRREQAVVVDARPRRVPPTPDAGSPAPTAAVTPAAVPHRSWPRAVDAVVFGVGEGDPDAVLALHDDAESGAGRPARAAPRAGSAGARTPTRARCSPAPSGATSSARRGGGGGACPASAVVATPTPPSPSPWAGRPRAGADADGHTTKRAASGTRRSGCRPLTWRGQSAVSAPPPRG